MPGRQRKEIMLFPFNSLSYLSKHMSNFQLQGFQTKAVSRNISNKVLTVSGVEGAIGQNGIPSP